VRSERQAIDSGRFLEGRRFRLPLDQGALIMGVLNVTPDSFYDGGNFLEPERAVAKGLELVFQGADILDIGGESSRPGSDPISAEEELRRILPVIRHLVREIDIPISVDTYKAHVARAALEEGVDIINDISGLQFDPPLAQVAAAFEALIVVMHTSGRPKRMQEEAQYGDLISEIIASLKDSIRRGMEAGIALEKFVVDPGIGFGKTTLDNLRILRELEAFHCLGRPILVGISRKSFIGKVLDIPLEERLEGSLAAVSWAISKGAEIVRTHDVRATRHAIKMLEAIEGNRSVMS
jgi:dihydropteroate synthase